MQLTSIVVPEDRARFLHELAKLDADTLTILADLSRKPGIEMKLKKNVVLIKSFL